jgi:hypothetical protein
MATLLQAMSLVANDGSRSWRSVAVLLRENSPISFSAFARVTPRVEGQW